MHQCQRCKHIWDSNTPVRGDPLAGWMPLTKNVGLGFSVEYGAHNDDEPWDEGWETWLCKQCLWHPALSPTALYTCYHRFSKQIFEVVPHAEWWQFFRDLLPMEHAFTYGEAIGWVD